MALITVFEDPWPKHKAKIRLETAAIWHLQIMEIFLKLLPHFRQDENGNIHAEALAYSEWRYINYIRFLDWYGVSADDCPPTWDIAIIWYCHLLSPYKFHRHLWDSSHRSYGLNHNQFPLSELLRLHKSGKWSHRETKKKWDRWNKMEGKSPHLPFQIWASPPWEPQQVRRRTVLLSMLSSKKGQKNEVDAYEPEIVFVKYGWCKLNGRKKWELPDWTQVREGKRKESCYNQWEHQRRGECCELTPWPTLQDLRDWLDRQIGFWKAAIKARDSDPEFASFAALERTAGDYEGFINLFWRPQPKKTSSSKPKADPDTIPLLDSSPSLPSNRDCVPPTLAIDLLWHTHRLYPANYWIWSFQVAGRLVDYEHTASAAAAKWLLEQTRSDWKMKYNLPCPTQYAMDEAGMDEYVPDAAAVPPGHPGRAKALWILGGMNPIRDRRRRTRGTYYVYDGVYVPFDSGDCGSGDGGGGGGDGGCGGDGGGGGGDGGGG